MSIDRSLKVRGALSRHRNVLSRAERIDALKLLDKWSEGDKVTGLVKVGHRKSHSGKKAAEKKPAAEGAAAAETKPAAPAK